MKPKNKKIVKPKSEPVIEIAMPSIPRCLRGVKIRFGSRIYKAVVQEEK